MGCVDINADADHALGGEIVRVNRTERLAQHGVCASVHQPKRLCVALDRHRRDDALGAALGHENAHALGKRTASGAVQKLEGVLSLTGGVGACHLILVSHVECRCRNSRAQTRVPDVGARL